MTNKKRILVNSLVTVVAVSAIGVNVASANLSPKKQRDTISQETFKNNGANIAKKVENSVLIHKQVDVEADLRVITLAYELRQEGKYQQAKEVLYRAGIEHPGYESKYGPKVDMRDAIENGDWLDFKEITKDKQINNIINTKEKFDMFAEAHELRKDGRMSEANAIMKELRINM